MFNKESQLERRVDRIKFYATTDQLDFYTKRKFIMDNTMLILETFYGGFWHTVWQIFIFVLKKIFSDIKWWSKTNGN